MKYNRTGTRYLWLRYVWCLIRGHQAPYYVPNGMMIEEVFVPGVRLEYVCPRCGDDVRTPERETF